MPSFVHTNDREFLRHVHDLRGRFVEGHGRILRANRDSAEWLHNRVAQNLRAVATRRAPDDRNRTRLAAVLSDTSLSEVTSHGIRFLINDKVKAANERAWRYYRVIEGAPGSENARFYWVRETSRDNNRFRLAFFGPGGPHGQQARGSWVNTRFPIVRIRHPVPAYHYIENAIEEFIRQDIARRNIQEQLGGLGIPVRGA